MGRVIVMACILAVAACIASVLCMPGEAHAVADGDVCAYAYLDPTDEDASSYELVISETERTDDPGFVAVGPVIARDDNMEFFTGRLLAEMSLDSACVTSVRIEGSVVPLSVLAWFANLEYVTKMDLEGLDTSQADNFTNAFSYCSSLRSLDLGSFDVSHCVEGNAYNMFSECPLEEITLNGSFANPNVADALGQLFGVRARRVADGSTEYVSTSAWVAQGDESTMVRNAEELQSYLSHVEGPVKFGALSTSDETGGICAYASADGATLYIREGKRDDGIGAHDDVLLGNVYEDNLPSWLKDGTLVPWKAGRSAYKKVVFETDVHPVSTADWFAGFTRLSEIEGLEHLDMSNVVDAGGMFASCPSLGAIDLSGMDTSKVTNMGSMFTGCTSLAHVTLGGAFDTSSVTSMSHMFHSCYRLEIDGLEDFAMGNVQDVQCMFENCMAISRFDFGDSDVAGVVRAYGMLGGCSGLEALDLGDTDWSNLPSTAMFDGCDSLGTVEVGPNAKNVKAVFPDGMWARQQEDGSMRNDEVPDGAAVYERVAPHAQSIAVLTSDGELRIGVAAADAEQGDEVYAFDDCGYEQPEDVPWHGEVARITMATVEDAGGVSSCAYWFDGCANLDSVDLRGLGSDVLKSASGLFKGCSSLASVDVTALSGPLLRGLSELFAGCTSLKRVDFSSCSFGHGADLTGMFDGCSSLKKAVLPTKVSTVGVTRMFRLCSSLKTIDVTGLDTQNIRDFSEMFRNCTKLKALDLSSFNTRRANSMKRAFHGCRQLQTISLGANFTFRGSTIARLMGSELPSGAWKVDGVDDKAYASDSVPNYANAAFTRATDAEIENGLTIESVRGDTASGSAKYTMESRIEADAETGEKIELVDYVLDDSYESDTFVIGESALASASKKISSSTVTQLAVNRAVTNPRVTNIVIGSSVKRIEGWAFCNAWNVNKLTVKSRKLTKKARVLDCLAGSNITRVKLSIGSSSARKKVKRAFTRWSGKYARVS